jgi:prepilin signal peptidase PulO-like enzyme (type II secretory pathway)
MLNNLFTGIFDTAGAAVISVPDFLLCIVVSLLIGAFITWVYTYKNRYTTSFAVTLAMLPAIVCIVIMMVNGNVGAGVAVAGAFSLVRFRSVPGTAKEIGTIFLAMAAGLIAGMGYLGFAVLFSLIMGAVMFVLNVTGFGVKKAEVREKYCHNYDRTLCIFFSFLSSFFLIHLCISSLGNFDLHASTPQCTP